MDELNNGSNNTRNIDFVADIKRNIFQSPTSPAITSSLANTTTTTNISSTSKVAARVEEQRRQFATELIHIILKEEDDDNDDEEEEYDNEEEDEDDEGKRDAGYDELLPNASVINVTDDSPLPTTKSRQTTWKVQRFRLTIDFLQQLVNRIPYYKQHGHTVAYLQHVQDEDVILPQEVQRLCKAYPKSSYYMILSEPNRTRDVLQQQEQDELKGRKQKDDSDGSRRSSSYHYEGKMKFIVRNVQSHTQNGFYEVTSQNIKDWVTRGILEEEPKLCQLQRAVDKLAKEIADVEARMEKVATEGVFATSSTRNMIDGGAMNNTPLTGKKADVEREIKFNKLYGMKDELRVERERTIDSVNELQTKICKGLDLVVLKEETIEKQIKSSNNGSKSRNTWSVTVLGEGKEYFENLIVAKGNWKTCLMFGGTAHVEKDESEGSDEGNSPMYFLDENSEHLVDTAGITVERVEHGLGSCHNITLQEDEKESNNSWKSKSSPWKDFKSHHIDAYYGTFLEGVKSGCGVMYTPSFLYGGDIENDYPCGEGHMLFKDGDLIYGKFDSSINSSLESEKSQQHQSLLRSNRYERGLPKGNVTITFSDGAFYDGKMKYGKIHGKGTYISSTGDQLEGEFKDGSLINGTIEKSCGEIFEGLFVNECLSGEGKHYSKKKRSKYRGTFKDGEKHGMGEETFENRDKSICNTHFGFYLNGMRTGSGRLHYYDKGFHNNWEINNYQEEKLKELYVDCSWLAGRSKAGGMITKVGTNTSFATTNRAASKFQWLYKLKRVEKLKESQIHEDNVRVHEVSKYCRIALQDKKRTIFEMHRNNLLAKLTSAPNDDSLISQLTKETLKLPSQSKHYTHQNVFTAPKSLVDAKKMPGLCASTYQRGKHDYTTIQCMHKSVDTKLLEKDLTPIETEAVKLSRDEYRLVLEKWITIDVDNIRALAKKGLVR